MINSSSINDLQKRLKALESKRDEIVKELEIELNENQQSEDMNTYFLLMYDREMVERQIEKVLSFISSIENIDSTKEISKTVAIGSCVKLKNHTHSLDICIVNTNDAQPTEGMISHISPIGKAIIGKKKGDEVVVQLPGREIEYKIIEIE